MKKYFLIKLILLLPIFSFAAFNDAILTTDTIIKVGEYELNVHSQNTVAESIVVNENNFVVTLLPNSSFSVSSETKAGFMVNSSGSNVTSSVTCGGPSILTLTPSNGVSVITVTPIEKCTPTTKNIVKRSGSYISTSIDSQQGQPIKTIVLQPKISTNNLSFNITRTLKYKMTGEDVKSLQIYLNTHGFIISSTGVGSLGKETNYFGLKTKQAVMVFQKVNGLTPDGVVGPKTRAVMK